MQLLDNLGLGGFAHAPIGTHGLDQARLALAGELHGLKLLVKKYIFFYYTKWRVH